MELGGQKRRKREQMVAGGGVEPNQVGQKTTVEAGTAITREEAIFQIHLGYLGYSCMLSGDR